MTMNTQQFEERKRDHIRHALDPSNQATGQSRLGEIHLFHEALPDLDFEEIELETPVLGRGGRTPALATPFYVPGMTAGHPDAPKLNRTLALACERRGWAMGVGSQRRELEARAAGDLKSASLDAWRELRTEVPNLVLVANIGISQAIRVGSKEVQSLADSLGAQAVAIHLNALQEALQPEGTPQFRGSMSAILRLCSELKTPVILKETGCGFSRQTLARLPAQGIAGIDLSGLGGTHWGRMEGARSAAQSPQARGAVTFANWGESLVDSLHAARKVFDRPQTRPEIWASGGIRSGLDAAKAIALGANRVGFAQPALEAALQGERALDSWMAQMEYELKVALFCTGCRDPKTLREKEGVWTTSGT
ncbi:MAG: type 2 isopentenyl-diphosphate Delta-isomerase [Oligoflexia bacterium]|nr:type 2 isopentenyl-diphosphate Delta-isomerase [Oligoflexia bacterium]